MDSATSRKVKRPRSATPSKGDSAASPPPKKKSKGTKKTKKTKKTRSSSSLDMIAGPPSPLPPGATTKKGGGTTKSNKPARESQASTQGEMMAQMISTFSKVEQSRFEAFQRARLTPHHISEWVAACISNRWNLSEPRPLADLVAVGQAPDIALVVGVLAKIHAQRIVQTAVKLRDENNNNNNSNNGSNGGSTTTATNNTENTPLTVEDLKRAVEERQRAGLDPGFFLQSAEERPKVGITRYQNKLYEQQRLAALDAQDKYDEWVKEQQQQQEKQQEKEQQEEEKAEKEQEAEKEGGEDDKMQVDSPERKE